MGPSGNAQSAGVKTKVEAEFRKLGLDPAVFLEVLDASTKQSLERKGHPVGLWFGGASSASAGDLQLLQELFAEDFRVLPLVEDARLFLRHVPIPELNRLNAREWGDPKLPADIMRLFGLSRDKRQAFISYRRKDSQGLANQLFENLSLYGYSPFLDISSIEAAEPVQDVLRHRLADVDLVIFIDSPTAPASDWILEELTTAEHLGLGILQLVWPNKSPHPASGLSRCHRLDDTHFVNRDLSAKGILTDAALAEVLQLAESERIQSLGFRRRRVISEFLEQARTETGLEIVVHPIGPMEVRSVTDNKVIAWALPFIGCPDGWTVHQEHRGLPTWWESFKYNMQDFVSSNPAEKGRLEYKFPTRIVYDSLGIQAATLDHLHWLTEFLPAKVLPIDRMAGATTTPIKEWLHKLKSGGQP
jgi:hypothetical protein